MQPVKNLLRSAAIRAALCLGMVPGLALGAALGLGVVLGAERAAARVEAPSRTPTHEDILRGFDASALSASRDDVAYGGSYDPVGMIVKWQKPIVYKIEGLRSRPDAINLAVATLKQQAALVGLEVRDDFSAIAVDGSMGMVRPLPLAATGHGRIGARFAGTAVLAAPEKP